MNRIEIGQTYRLGLRGLRVDVVADGFDRTGNAYFTDDGTSYHGQFFIGITRDDRGDEDTGTPDDWAAAYTPRGKRLWDSEDARPNPAYDLKLAQTHVALKDVENIIDTYTHCSAHHRNEMVARIRQLPSVEL